MVLWYHSFSIISVGVTDFRNSIQSKYLIITRHLNSITQWVTVEKDGLELVKLCFISPWISLPGKPFNRGYLMMRINITHFFKTIEDGDLAVARMKEWTYNGIKETASIFLSRIFSANLGTQLHRGLHIVLW